MHIEKLTIENFKGFKNKFTIAFNKGMNVIVGNNEEGKTTILEAINLVLTGLINGRPLKNELSQYLFNAEAVQKYIDSLTTKTPLSPPNIQIEAYLSGDGVPPELEGNLNSDNSSSKGILLKIEFNDDYKEEYEALIKEKAIFSLPIEYYHIIWKSFARKSVTAKSISLKAALIDTTSSRYKNGSDIYIARIIKELLGPEEIVGISQAHRSMIESFMNHDAVEKINTRINEATKITSKKVNISAELSTRGSWEDSLVTYIDNVPFNYIGKGEQSLIKTNLALSNNKTSGAGLLLVEEPENHLSHTKLNNLISVISGNTEGKQIVVTTHSSFVANKLGLESLILLNNRETLRLKDLSPDTNDFFSKISGYDTLRLLLCKKVILVEGDSDELIVQRSYLDLNKRLPIEDEVDVISVGTSFLRFLEISEKLKKPTVVITDNDGDVEAVKNKYSAFLNKEASGLKISFDESIDTGELKTAEKNFNYNTLEPKIAKENGLDVMNKVLGLKCKTLSDLHIHMRANKTDCALKIFNSAQNIKYPKYISDPISSL